MRKEFTTFSFGLMTLATALLGFLTLRRTSQSVKPPSATFLNRDQTEEWKGWMQYIILIYHYTGASKVLGIYGVIRLMVASYLFMTGYGHTIFFYKKKDFSLKRAAAVLVRLNLLSILLPYVMGTDYLFYYFAPLVTFWFAIVWSTMRIGSSNNTNTTFLLAKVGISALLVTCITRIPIFFEALFGMLHVLCKTQWNTAEWRFRVLLDIYIVYVGQLMAILYIKFCDEGWSSRPWFPRLRRLAIGFSAIALVAFLWIQPRLIGKSKAAYNHNYNPFLSWIPIVAFVVLRNATPWARNVHSTGFAWVGKISLETFTLQFHIWMAADTKGLLDSGLFRWAGENGSTGWWINLAVLTTIFVGVSYWVAEVTGVLTTLIVNGPKKRDPSTQPRAHSRNISRTVREANDMEVGESLLGHTSPSSASKKFHMLQSLMAEDLRFRLAVLAGALWLLNLTST